MFQRPIFAIDTEHKEEEVVKVIYAVWNASRITSSVCVSLWVCRCVCVCVCLVLVKMQRRHIYGQAQKGRATL